MLNPEEKEIDNPKVTSVLKKIYTQNIWTENSF
jgi:hypothetical protein